MSRMKLHFAASLVKTLPLLLASTMANAQSSPSPLLAPAGLPPEPSAPSNNDGRPQGHRPHLTPEQKCIFGLHEIAQHLYGVDAMVSRDGSSITINADRHQKMANSDSSLIGTGEIEIYGKSGKSRVDGLSCSFDKSQKIGDGAAKLIDLFANEHAEFLKQMAEHRQKQLASNNNPASGIDGDHRRHHKNGEQDPMQGMLKNVVEQCASVYPEIETIRASMNLPVPGNLDTSVPVNATTVK